MTDFIIRNEKGQELKEEVPAEVQAIANSFRSQEASVDKDFEQKAAEQMQPFDPRGPIGSKGNPGPNGPVGSNDLSELPPEDLIPREIAEGILAAGGNPWDHVGNQGNLVGGIKPTMFQEKAKTTDQDMANRIYAEQEKIKAISEELSKKKQEEEEMTLKIEEGDMDRYYDSALMGEDYIEEFNILDGRIVVKMKVRRHSEDEMISKVHLVDEDIQNDSHYQSAYNRYSLVYSIVEIVVSGKPPIKFAEMTVDKRLEYLNKLPITVFGVLNALSVALDQKHTKMGMESIRPNFT